LILVPYWNSALNPYWDPNARGITIGWTGDHGPLHLFRAILEGIAFELRLHFEGVEAAIGSPIGRLAVMGGGSRSDSWCQIIADVTGKRIQRTQVVDAAALGAGIIAAYGAGCFKSIENAVAEMAGRGEKWFTPNELVATRYSQIFTEIYCHIFPALQVLSDRLNSIQPRST
jgi:xylulokinase